MVYLSVEAGGVRYEVEDLEHYSSGPGIHQNPPASLNVRIVKVVDQGLVLALPLLSTDRHKKIFIHTVLGSNYVGYVQSVLYG